MALDPSVTAIFRHFRLFSLILVVFLPYRRIFRKGKGEYHILAERVGGFFLNSDLRPTMGQMSPGSPDRPPDGTYVQRASYRYS
jgi:hypothetical protein